MTDTADTVTVPTVAAVWVGLEGIGGQIPSPSLESVVPARGTLPLSGGGGPGPPHQEKLFLARMKML